MLRIRRHRQHRRPGARSAEAATTRLLAWSAVCGVAGLWILLRVNHSLATVSALGVTTFVWLAIKALDARRSVSRALLEHRQLRALLHSVADTLVVLDADLVIRFASSEVMTLLGHRRSQLVGRAALDLVHPEDREIAGQAAAAMFERNHTPSISAATRLRLRRRDGRWVPVDIVGKVNDRVPMASGPVVVMVLRDVSEQVRTEHALRMSTSCLAAIVQTAPDAIITTDDTGTIERYNAVAARMFGYTQDQVIGKNIRMLMPDRDAALHDGHLEQYRETGHQHLLRRARELEAKRRDNSVFPIWIGVGEAQVGDRRLFTAIIRDISEQRALRDQLRFQAQHDPLTGLLNREELLRRIELAQARAQRSGQVVAVALLDLDRFKTINDVYGHSAGDRLLIEVGRTLVESVRAADAVGRIGGDEFVVLLDGVGSIPDVSRLIDRLEAAIRNDATRDAKHRTTASVGVAIWQGGVATAEDLVCRADAAMYRAKRNGGASVELFDDSLQRWIEARRSVETSLRSAIRDGEFVLHYQPIIDAETGTVAAVESLIRWDRPGLGVIGPGEFIGIAEESDLIVELGCWVLFEACRQAAQWSDRGIDLRISVNASARQICRAEFVDEVASALHRTGLEAGRLCVEVTETAILPNEIAAVTSLGQIDDLGVGVSLDDFGTGYSSLTHLQQLPITTIKIDQSFVRGVGERANDATIVAATIGLARGLGVKVVAEGVETASQLAALHGMGCDFFQGYLFSKPVGADEIPAIVHAHAAATLLPSAD